jgi:hypothetical protein
MANAAYKLQKRNEAMTEVVRMPHRGHSLTIDAGWREVAVKSLEFVRRFSAPRLPAMRANISEELRS